MVPFPLNLFLYLPFIMGLDSCHSSSLTSTQSNESNAILFRRDFGLSYFFMTKCGQSKMKKVCTLCGLSLIYPPRIQKKYIRFIWYLINFVWVCKTCVYIMKNYYYSYSFFFSIVVVVFLCRNRWMDVVVFCCWELAFIQCRHSALLSKT